MPPEIVVPIAALAALCLGRLALGPARRAREPDPRAAAERFVLTRIDAHIERLSRAYMQPGGESADDQGVEPAFAQEIEAFIGNVVLWDALLATDADDDLSSAVRELVVRDRPYVDARILARVRDHLAPPPESAPPEQRVS